MFSKLDTPAHEKAGAILENAPGSSGLIKMVIVQNNNSYFESVNTNKKHRLKYVV